jgi:hypothetical protein
VTGNTSIYSSTFLIEGDLLVFFMALYDMLLTFIIQATFSSIVERMCRYQALPVVSVH